MAIKIPVTITPRHRQYIRDKVAKGEFASQSAMVADALEQMIMAEAERDQALVACASDIRARMQTPLDDFIDEDTAFAAARQALTNARKA